MRVLALLPGRDVRPADLVLYALGLAAVVTVAVSTVEQLVRAVLLVRPPQVAGETLAAAVGVGVVIVARGVDRTSLWILGVRALSLAGTFIAALLTYAYVGRSVIRDPLEQVAPACGSLLAGAAVGLVIGIVARALLPAAAHDASSTSVLIRAIGVAIVAGAIVHFVFPTAFFVAVGGSSRPDDIRTAALQLPELLAGPIAAGIYAARRATGYAPLLAAGALLALPSAIVEASIFHGALEANDPSLRGAFAAGSALLILRIAAWPLAAAFANGFLTPAADRHTVSSDT